jgi:DNA-binding response OmpR family regulator
MDTEFNGSSKTPTILVADGTFNHLRLMCDILLEQFWMVRPVSKAGEIMQEISDISPDLIILDVMMPDIDGFELCTALKKNPATRHIPVIIVTSMDNRESRLRGLQAGADDYFAKPVNPAEIQVSVRDLLQMNKRCELQRQVTQESSSLMRSMQ